MLRNYLTTALRALRRYKGYVLLDLLGLAVGMAACLLIGLYVRDELSYDRFHDHADRIVRVVEDHRDDDGQITHRASTPSRLAPVLQAAFPAVEKTVRLYPYNALLRRDAERTFQEEQFFFADSTFFNVFSFAFRHGDPQTVLDAPFSLVLTASAADRFFPNTHPVGQTLRLDTRHVFTVTGVVEDVPPNAHFAFDAIASYTSLREVDSWVMSNWHYPPMYTYLLLAEGSDVEQLEARFAAFVEQHFDAEEAADRRFLLQPLTSIHLHSQREQEIAPTGDITTVYLFSIVAGFILLIACVNFVNLATARAVRRTREVGVRKALGAGRGQLVWQFLSESVLTAIAALVLAVLIAGWALPVFNAVAGMALPLTALLSRQMLGVAAGLVVFVGLLAGSYPALYLAAFRPAQVLGATMQRGGLSASALRRGLIVVQFTIAIVLVVGTGITYQQMNYVQHKRLGFDEEQIVVVPLRDEIDQRTYPALKKRWLQHPGVEHVTASSGVPGRSGIHHFQISFPASQDSLYAPILAVDPDFTETFGVQMTAGRDFSPAYGTDTSSAFVINEAAAERLGWSAPVGERLSLTYKGPSGRFTTKSGKVIGVMENIHYHSLHQEIEPLLLHVVPPSFYSDYLSVRIASGQASDVLAFLGEQWQAFSPERPFEYSFLDAEVDAQYRAERRFSLLVGLFAGLAIAIACLGLFSLAAFAAAQRTKEIGIRKTLGASIPSIVGLLSKEFARLVAVAFVVAAPIAYWAVQQWLDGFAYRIDVGPWMFVGAGVLALSAALLTVSYQAVKAARIDPVNALRYE